MLDYDGTLVPIAATPELAAPDEELLRLLASVAARPRTTLHVVSGRPRTVLTAWLGTLPAALWAEHGAYYRPSPGQPWESCVAVPADWMRGVDQLLEKFATSTPGSLLERKSVSVAWHYRNVQPALAAKRAHALRLELAEATRDKPIETLEGRKVIEVRFRGVSKAIVARHVRAAYGEAATVLAIGDDRTDQELFEALPASSLKVAVGAPARHANCVLRDYTAVRALLRALVTGSPAAARQIR